MICDIGTWKKSEMYVDTENEKKIVSGSNK